MTLVAAVKSRSEFVRRSSWKIISHTRQLTSVSKIKGWLQENDSNPRTSQLTTASKKISWWQENDTNLERERESFPFPLPFFSPPFPILLLSKMKPPMAARQLEILVREHLNSGTISTQVASHLCPLTVGCPEPSSLLPSLQPAPCRLALHQNQHPTLTPLSFPSLNT